MRLETVPLVLAVLAGLLGLFLLWDAAVSDARRPLKRERRRRARVERDRVGEAALGLGTLAMAAALAGGDVWRYGNVAVIAGTVLFAVGIALNLRYLRDVLMDRGPARRQGDRSPRGPEADRYVHGDAMGAGEPRPAAADGGRDGRDGRDGRGDGGDRPAAP